MPSDPNWYVGAAWTLLLIVWVIGAFRTKRTERSASRGARLGELCLLVVAFSLLFRKSLRFGPLAWRVIPETPPFQWAGLAIAIVGIGFAMWARFYLGSNWSAIAGVKQGHSLVRSGPYSMVRHPIYTGLIVAGFGTALVSGALSCFVALPLMIVAWRKKSLIEEGFMREQFGPEYQRYMHEVKALIPFVW
ncbi:MAG TPA: isoprenylcysteine carboxylmethyltransferase family protein [Candidatus Acidoferrales bacterium]|jgi:protein-S-isoprenylcysteine O-methyltransferase Ste14|nr:isoprenylcysteine carboxylmethyltransferase family protein [Candidatus Acidoferrales bacterium]